MAFYRFHLDVNVPPTAVADRLRAISGGKLSLFDSTSFSRPDPWAPPFKGTVTDASFNLRRNISYRNSFLPFIRGNFEPGPAGTRITVTMHLQPFVAIFMVFWLTMAVGLTAGSGPLKLVPWAFFLFGIAMVVFGFFPEAIKAKRLITAALTAATAAETAQPIG
jgi:hypothetical protein